MRQLRELEPGDVVLVERLKRGDAEAFAGLLRRYQGKVYRLAMNMTRNPQDAEEVMQDVFLAVARKIGNFDGRAAFSTWLYRVTANAALIKLRRRGVSPTSPSRRRDRSSPRMAPLPGRSRTGRTCQRINSSLPRAGRS